MRKYGKLAISLLLAVSVILSILPYAFARTWSDVDTFQKEIDMLTGLGFMRGENSKQFFPGDYIDNAELIRVLMNVRNVTKGDGVRRFQDVPNNYYAFNEISAAIKLGYITVPENRMFYPEEKASADKALDIILKMLNYDVYIRNSKDTLRQIAQKAGLLEGLSLGEYITKGEFAKLIYNSFTSGMLEGSGIYGVNAVYEPNYEKTTLSFHNWKMIRGNVTGNERTSLYYSGDPAGAGKVRIDNEFFFEGESFAGDLLGYEVDAVITNEKASMPTIIYAAAERNTNVLTVSAEEIDSVKDLTFNHGGRKHIQLKKSMLLVYNGLAVPFSEEIFDIEYGDVTFISTSGGRRYDIVLINEYESYLISSVAPNDKKIYVKRGLFNKKDYVEYETNIYQDVRIFKNGQRATEADLSNEAAIMVYFADGERDLITIEIGTSKAEGKIVTSGVSEKTERKMLSFGEDEYLLSPNVFGEEFITLGETVALTLDYKGYVVAVKKISYSDNYGVVTWVGYDDLNETALVKIFKADGTFETFKTVSEEFKFVKGKSVDRVEAIDVKEKLSSMLRSDVIMYNTNQDGVLNKITIADAYDFKNEMNNQGKFTLYRYQQTPVICNRVYIDGIAYGNALSFVIPEDAVYQDKLCRVVEGGPFTANNSYSGYKMYNVGLNGAAGIILHRSTVGNTIPSWDGAVFMVQKVIDTINEDDEPVKAIVLYSKGKTQTLPINKNATNVTSVVEDSLEDAEFGDIINYGTNSNGEISAYTYLYKDDTSGKLTGNISSHGDGYDKTRAMAINRGYAKYFEDGIISLELDNDAILTATIDGETTYYKVNRADKTIEEGSLGAIRFKNFYANLKGSELVFRTNRGRAWEVFVYEN